MSTKIEPRKHIIKQFFYPLIVPFVFLPTLAPLSPQSLQRKFENTKLISIQCEAEYLLHVGLTGHWFESSGCGWVA